MINNVVSILAICSTVAVSIIGFPSQIREIKKAKNLKALSIIFFCLSFTAFSLFTLHGYLSNDKTVLIGQGLGAIASGTTLCVLLYSLYQQKRRRQRVS